jgi:DNA-directed RNA polymerase specialized sigma24 family protein
MTSSGSGDEPAFHSRIERVGATPISFSPPLPENQRVFMPYRASTSDAFAEHRQFLWDLSYRVTGSSVDADALLRDCFTKALEDPLRDRAADWHGHLTTIASRLAVAALRHRRRREYPGYWLPSPVETGNAASRGDRPGPSAHGARYDLVESGSFAFLMALEELEAWDRVIFLLCDVFGRELSAAAGILGSPAASARATLLRVRRMMQPYDDLHVPPTPDVQKRTADVLQQCLSHLQNRDGAGLEKVIAPDARALYDNAGEFVAPVAAVQGRNRIARILLKFADGMEPMRFDFRMLNGLPAAVGESAGRPRWARRFVFRIEVSRDGLVSEVHTITATVKLAAVRFDPA